MAIKNVVYCVAICLAVVVGVYGKQSALGKVDMEARSVDEENMRKMHVNAAKNSESGVSAGPAFSSWHGELGVGEEDHFAHVRPLIEQQEKQQKDLEKAKLAAKKAKKAVTEAQLELKSIIATKIVPSAWYLLSHRIKINYVPSQNACLGQKAN